MKCTCTYKRLKELGYINHLHWRFCPLYEKPNKQSDTGGVFGSDERDRR